MTVWVGVRRGEWGEKGGNEGGVGGGETHDITVMMLELEDMGNDNGDLYNMSQ